MVSSQNPLLLRFRLRSPWRSPLMHTLLHRNKHSSFLQRYRFKVHKKQQKRLALRPCSTKRLTWTKREQEDAREVQKKEEVETFREVEVKFKDENMDDLPGIPLAPSNQSKKPGIIFIFEKASLVPAFVGKTYQILNPDDHANFMRKKKMNPYNYRPEITLQVLFQVVNSRLYKAGRVQAIYVKTEEGVLIKIEAHTQIPETYGSFCAMMLELLQKFSIKAKGKREKLLRLIENPVTQHLPVNCYKIGLSFSSKKVVRLKDYIGSINDDANLVFVVGAMAHGKIDCSYTDDIISVSEFPLSAACCVRKICCAVWKKWKVK